jgi:glycosyltransferase involved in cell wall biosynthesis
MPNVDFTIVGDANRPTEYAERVKYAAERLKNVNMVGRVPHNEIGAYFLNADVLCCTSEYEGFPNVFLEAWSIGTPVITTCDPDGLVDSLQLGLYVESQQHFAAAIRKLSEQPALGKEMGSHARRYFVKRHSFPKAMTQFDRYFKHVLRQHYGEGYGPSVSIQ